MKHFRATLVIVSAFLFLAISFAQTPQATLPSQTTNGNCSPIFNGSGNTNNCNTGPTARRLDEKEKLNLSNCLAKHPGTANIAAIMDSPEANAFASDWLDVFKSAGWLIDDGVVHQGMIGGTLWTGTQIKISGSIDADGKNPKYDSTSAGGIFAVCTLGKPFAGGATLILSKDVAADHVDVFVGPDPQQ